MVIEPVTVLFYGPAGCGKGTQLAELKKYLEQQDTTHAALRVETGAAFREFIGGNDSYSGALTKEIVNKGNLPDVFVSIWLWASILIKNFTGQEHLLFDGFPRRIIEAEVLDGALSLYGRENVVLFVMHVPAEKSIERLKARQRADDLSEEIVRKRLAWYREDVLPTVDYYRQKGGRYHVVDIDGSRSIEEVRTDIISHLKSVYSL